MISNVLSIAGSDPSGGAGIQADLKTFAALGCYGMAAITALTAQNTRGVQGVHVPPADFVAQQIDAIFADIRVDAVKIGMLATAEITNAVAAALRRHRPRSIVLDPVMVATSGDTLLAPEAIAAVRECLLPIATLVTPNLPEAGLLLGAPGPRDLATMGEAARALRRLGASAVLVKGGHLASPSCDDLLWDGTTERVLTGPRIATRHTHGTGCTLSSAIAARLAQGANLAVAVADAKAYLIGALEAADHLAVGQGHGPAHHGWNAKHA
ncbi:bifunctional hydroxymethylpyrimidine kinase/phosphomethylpyrimidine kinase [Dongia deserti]|uniref:bifunctional hydroxymethylpyrimidine kinase/phosphomethylpyrimidine kinase n=1 Tax=Dongia deserti TaxID=2268030 RepID=UPI000E656BD1|nr:bifunctional hydroxymethylpyrimidine kinase/phosphomethylpyrimidine kinase [Dongia deserti]